MYDWVPVYRTGGAGRHPLVTSTRYLLTARLDRIPLDAIGCR
jgi:hypothetical protein